jgi:hypothetical protein
VGEPRRDSLVILSEVLPCSRFDRKVRQYILATPLGNRSSPAMTHYGIEIYNNNNTIMPSIYANPVVRYTNYLFTPQAYNTSVVDRSHVVMPASSSMLICTIHIVVLTCLDGVIIMLVSEHVSNIHNGFMPSYSSTELASHCKLQTHMPMSNCYSRADMRASANFGQSLYTTSDSIRMEIAPNMVSAPPGVSSAFHSASPVYSRVEKSSANTPTSSTNGSDVDKGFDTKLTIEDLPVEYHQKFEAINMKMEETFMARYDVISQGLIL